MQIKNTLFIISRRPITNGRAATISTTRVYYNYAHTFKNSYKIIREQLRAFNNIEFKCPFGLFHPEYAAFHYTMHHVGVHQVSF